MSERAEDKPEHACLGEHKSTDAGELQQRHGAHVIGIGWKKVAVQEDRCSGFNVLS